MQNKIDKSKVKKSFSRSAKTYDEYATIQNETANEIVSKALNFIHEPKIVLDVGAGTGACSLALKQKIPLSKLYAIDIATGMTKFMHDKCNNFKKKISLITADAQYLPFRDSSFNLIISNLSYQWIDDITDAFRETHEALTSQGIFAFSTLGKNTFKELKEAYCCTKTEKTKLSSLHIYKSHDEIKNNLDKNGFEIISNESKIIKKKYSTVHTFLRVLKYIGAKNAIENSTSKGLNKKKALNDLINYYQKNFSIDSNEVFATYELLFFIAKKNEYKRYNA